MDPQQELAKLILSASANEGMNQTSIPGVRLLKFTSSTLMRQGTWPRSLVFVVQGQKEITLLNNERRFGEAHYLVTPIDLMVQSRVKVPSSVKPYLAILLNLDQEKLANVASQMRDFPFPKPKVEASGIYSGPMNEKMLGAALRLLKLTESPDEAAVLAPLAISELYFLLLRSPNGFQIYQMALAKSDLQKISAAVAALKSDLHHVIDVNAMAKKASMSRTSFFRAFKKHTTLSPVQFLKSLRLNEAQKLLRLGSSAEAAAFSVGYKSASQFSREYTRHFGRPPSHDAD